MIIVQASIGNRFGFLQEQSDYKFSGWVKLNGGLWRIQQVEWISSQKKTDETPYLYRFESFC